MKISTIGLVALTLSTGACSGGQETVAKPPQVARVAASHTPAPAPEPEGLEVNQIQPVVEAGNSAVRGCHTIEFSGAEATAGSMAIDLEINPDGTVASAILADSSFADHPGLESCVIDVTRNFHFPRANAPTEFTWRFKFRAPG